MSGGCTICAGALGKRNRSGVCRSCSTRAMNANPEHTAKIKAGMLRAFALDPQKRDAAKERARNARSSPRHAEWLRSQASDSMRSLQRRMAEEYPAGSEMRRRAGVRQSATKLAHVPPEKHADYRFLVDKKRIPAAEAARILTEEFDKEMRDFRRKLAGAHA